MCIYSCKGPFTLSCILKISQNAVWQSTRQWLHVGFLSKGLWKCLVSLTRFDPGFSGRVLISLCQTMQCIMTSILPTKKPGKIPPRPRLPLKPQTKKHEIVNQKLLVKGPKYLPTKKNLQHRCRIFPWVGSDPWEFWSKSARANGTVEISKARCPRLRLSWEKCLGFCCLMIYLHFIAT